MQSYGVFYTDMDNQPDETSLTIFLPMKGHCHLCSGLSCRGEGTEMSKRGEGTA